MRWGTKGSSRSTNRRPATGNPPRSSASERASNSGAPPAPPLARPPLPTTARSAPARGGRSIPPRCGSQTQRRRQLTRREATQILASTSTRSHKPIRLPPPTRARRSTTPTRPARRSTGAGLGRSRCSACQPSERRSRPPAAEPRSPGDCGMSPPAGTVRLVDRGVYRLSDNQSGPITFQLNGNGYRFAAGHTVKLELAPSDAPQFQASNSPFTVSVSKLEVEIPTVSQDCTAAIRGSFRRDVLSGTPDADAYRARQGPDRLRGAKGPDCLFGQSGGDKIRGGAGRDLIRGGSGHDQLNSRDGYADKVHCAAVTTSRSSTAPTRSGAANGSVARRQAPSYRAPGARSLAHSPPPARPCAAGPADDTAPASSARAKPRSTESSGCDPRLARSADHRRFGRLASSSAAEDRTHISSQSASRMRQKSTAIRLAAGHGDCIADENRPQRSGPAALGVADMDLRRRQCEAVRRMPSGERTSTSPQINFVAAAIGASGSPLSRRI